MLLDIFQIVFESNSKKATQDLEEVEKAGDDVEKSLDDARKANEKFFQSAESIGKAIGNMLAGYFAIGSILERIEEINAIATTAETIGDSVENVDAFSKALVEMGADASGARDTLTDLAESMGEALKDTQSGRFKQFKELGVALKDAEGNARATTDVMVELAGAVEGMSKQEAVFKIKELGITDNRSVELILKGRKELERMMRVQKEMGVTSTESAEASRRFTDALNKVKGAAGNAGAGLVDGVIPALTEVVEWLGTVVDWARDNKDFITGFFIAVAAFVTRFYLPAMIRAAVATLAAYAPMLLMGGIIAAIGAVFALAYDDVMNFIKGNDSLIGQIMGEFPALADAVYLIIGAFRKLGPVISEIMQGVWEIIKETLDKVLTMIGYVVKAIGSIFGAAASVGGWTLGKLGLGGGGQNGSITQELIQAGKSTLSAAQANPLNSQTSNSISNSNKTSNENNLSIGQMTVNAPNATDAKGVAAAIGGDLKKELKNMRAEAATGVAR